jgi:hypothetical protein
MCTFFIASQMSVTEEAIQATTAAIEAMSVDGEIPDLPDFVIVANPYPLPIEEVVARAYTNCPMYDELHGLTGGITRDGVYFESMVYDHGRDTSGLEGCLRTNRMPDKVYVNPDVIKSHHNGWLLFDFNQCCYLDSWKSWKANISKMVKMLRNDRPYGGYDDDEGYEVPQFDYKRLYPPYYKSNAMVGRITVKEKEVTPLTSMTWSLPESVDESTTYTLVPMPFINSGMDIGSVLYPLYIEDALIGFTVDDSDTYYIISRFTTRNCRIMANQNIASVVIEKGYGTVNVKGMQAAMPTGYRGGYFILEGSPATVVPTMNRIERLTHFKFSEAGSWRSTVIEPPSKYYKKMCVHVPTNIEMYNQIKDLYEPCEPRRR